MLTSHMVKVRGKKNVTRTVENVRTVTGRQVKTFLSKCENCQLKKSKKNKSMVVRPILSSRFNARGRADLIDLQRQPDEGLILTKHTCDCYVRQLTGYCFC